MLSNDLNTPAIYKEQCRVYVEVDNNEEYDISENNNRKFKNYINEVQIDVSSAHQRSFPKMLGENMNCMNQLLLLHFFEYCFTIKKLIIDKNKRRLSEIDLPNQRKFEEIEFCVEIAEQDILKIQKVQKIQNTQKIDNQLQWYDFIRILMKGELKNLIYLSVLGFLIDSISKNTITIIIQILLEKVQENDLNTIYVLGTSLIMTSFIGRLAFHHGYLKGEQFSSKARLLLINIIYNKLITLNAYSQKEAGIGNIFNVLTCDLDALEKNFVVIFQVFVLPINFIFAVVLMWFKFDGPIGLLPLLITLSLNPIQVCLSQFLGKLMSKYIIESDQRLKITNELIDGIRLIKTYAWQDAFKKFIKVIRTKECRYQLVYQFGFSLSRAIVISSQIWASCSFFIILYYLGYDEFLTIPNIISSIQLLNLFRQGCVFMFQYAVSSYINNQIAFRRIAKLYNMNNIELQNLDIVNLETLASEQSVTIQHFSAYWNKQLPVYQNLTLQLNPGEFWGLIGPIGSGKTTFLMSILKEIPYSKGLISLNSKLKIAYVEQEPFIFPDTVKHNITFGREFNKELYDRVVEASRLTEDIQFMENKDDTQIGEKGATLSGGQRARISLARALYSCADLYLLDDPLSAVDSKVANHLFQFAIKNFIYQYQAQELSQQPIVVLATHQLQYALNCSHIAMIEKGQLAFQGTTQEFKQKIQDNKESEKQIDNEKNNIVQENPQKTMMLKKESFKFNENFDKFKIGFRYFKMWNFYQLIMVILLNAGFFVIYQIYLRIVVTYDSKGSIREQQKVLQQLGYLTLGGFIIVYFKYVFTHLGCQKASIKIHDDMLDTLTNLPIQYFDLNPSGGIINKFSIDQNLADILTNYVVSDVIESVMGFLISLITIGILQSYFLIIVFFLLLGNYFIYTFFNQLIGQSKDIDLYLRGPQVDYIKKTLCGIMLIRTYNKAVWFKQQLIKQSNQLVMAILNQYYITRLFQLSIEATGLLAQIFGIYLVIYFSSDNIIVFSQQILLLSSFNDQITWGLKQLISFEIQLNTYNRMFKFIDQKQEEDNSKQNEELTDFPQNSTVEFQNVMVRYNQQSGLVLRDLSFKIAQGMKVGCVGRTGAGKSTISQVLFRMIEIETKKDSFIKISGIDIRTIGVQQLRSSIGIIPQTPFIFSATIRENLDPFNEFPDEDIFEVLKEIRLDQVVEKMNNKLLEQMNEQMFSTGQKQLICLARLILRKKKIIILDEATANLDQETDQFIQHLIKTKFIESTVITIAHRLNTIADYDRILLIDNGKAIEFDHPYLLMASNLDSQIIDRDTEFSRQVQSTGKSKSQEIFDISKQAFLKTQFPSIK